MWITRVIIKNTTKGQGSNAQTTAETILKVLDSANRKSCFQTLFRQYKMAGSLLFKLMFVYSGVPQGSFLPSILFLFFINFIDLFPTNCPYSVDTDDLHCSGDSLLVGYGLVLSNL